jgi:hypothetical protein
LTSWRLCGVTDWLSLIALNVGWPVIVFYGFAVVVTSIYYMDFRHSVLYATAVMSAVSCIWEIPMFVRSFDFGSSFQVGFFYLIPLVIMLGVFGVKPSLKPFWLLGVMVAVDVAYAALGPTRNLGVYTSPEYLTTFIPRGFTAYSLARVLRPEVKV